MKDFHIKRERDERHALLMLSFSARHRELSRRRSRLWRRAWKALTRY